MRAPNLIIGDPPQTLRWHLIRWRGWQLALHKWLKSDDDRALHDHSGDNISVILSPQGYIEILLSQTPGWPSVTYCKVRRAWIPYFRKAETPHRIALIDGKPVWSLWFRWPPRREWGFWCPKGWRHWKDFLNGDYRGDGAVSTRGRGCDE